MGIEETGIPPQDSVETPHTSDATPQPENKEKDANPNLLVKIDRAKLAQIQVPERKRYTDEEKVAGRRELEGVLDRLGRLPETLNFQPGITLIVGENGAGKSTFAKAIKLASTVSYQKLVYTQAGIEDETAAKNAYESIYHPGGAEDIWLRQAGLAPAISHAISAELPGDLGFEPTYLDPAEIIGKNKSLEQQELYEAGTQATIREQLNALRGDEVDYKARIEHTPLATDYRSHRQTVDEVLLSKLERDKQAAITAAENVELAKEHPDLFEGEVIGSRHMYVLDEPETGMSPRRHKKLAEEIKGHMPEGSIVITPTNSVVLYDSDLPRIDLDFPERGIHRPSQFPSES